MVIIIIKLSIYYLLFLSPHIPLVVLHRGARTVTADLVGRGELLVCDVAAPVLGDDRRVDDRADRGRGEREAHLGPREADDIQAEVGHGLALAVLGREEETRGGRVFVFRRNGRPNFLHVDGEKSNQRCAEQNGLES